MFEGDCCELFVAVSALNVYVIGNYLIELGEIVGLHLADTFIKIWFICSFDNFDKVLKIGNDNCLF